MKKDVLIITSVGDAHADAVVSKIENLGVRTFRFNTDQLKKYEITFKISSQNTLAIRNRANERTLSTKSVGAVWYRRPMPDKTMDKVLDGEGKRFFRGESKEWVKSIALALRDSFWVVAPWLLYVARIKSNQLLAAQSVGLNIPKSLFARDRKLVRQFFDECTNGMIAKTLKTQYSETGHYGSSLRTQEITRRDLNDKSLFISPCIFQEKIAVAYEVRVVAIGRRLFPFKVAVKRSSNVLDIRANELEDIEYTPVSISKGLSLKICKLLDHFQLPFSSMDLLVDERGKEYFIDLNPNGQWLWLEMATGTVMSDLFARMLASRQIPDRLALR